MTLILRGLAPAVVCLMLACAASPARADQFWPDLSTPQSVVGGGEKDAAVIIGAENYLRVAKVPGAAQNAADWHAYLTETLKVPLDRVALLRDDEATVELMREKTQKAASEVEPGGTLWFIFIGHGAPSKNGKDGLLVGVDAQQRPDSLFARSFPQNELLRIASAGRQDRTVLLIDACFSGRTSEGQPLVKGLQPLILKYSEGMAQLQSARTILLTAAKADQFAGPLPGAGRPAFSYLALGGLRGWADEKGQGKVTAEGLWNYVSKALRALGSEQEPEIAAFSKGQTFSAGREKGPDLGSAVRKLSPGGADFQVSASNLPAVPKAEAPKALDSAAGGLDFRGVDVEALKKYSAAVEFDEGSSAPEDKAQNWRQLADEAPKFAELARKRAEAWEQYAEKKRAEEEARRQRIEARDADWGKLSQLLALNPKAVPETDKARWAEQFVGAYLDSPGLSPASAAALAGHMPPGPRKTAVAALAQQAGPAAAKPAAPAAPAPSRSVRYDGAEESAPDIDNTIGAPDPVSEAFAACAKSYRSGAGVKACEDFLERYPDDALAADANFLIGEANLEAALSNKGPSAELLAAAQKAYEREISRYGKSGLAPSAQYRLGEVTLAYPDFKPFKPALGQFSKVERDFPKSYVVPESLFGVARAFATANMFARAEQTVDRLTTAYPAYRNSPQVRSYSGISARNGWLQTPPPLHSAQVIQAWRTTFASRRGIIFHPRVQLGEVLQRKLDSREAKAYSWTLTIADEEGRVFQHWEGSSDPPEELVWSGQNDQGLWMEAGRAYSLVFLFTDPGGSPRTWVGAPIRPHAMVHQGDDGLHIQFDSSLLFGPSKSGESPDPKTRGILRAAADLVKRRFYGIPLSVRVRASNKELGQRQAQSIRDYLLSALMLPADAVSTNADQAGFSDQTAEIVLLNR